MPAHQVEIMEETFADFTGHMCHAERADTVSNEPLSERQQNHLAACFQIFPFTQSVSVRCFVLTPDSVSVEKETFARRRVIFRTLLLT
ncbi:hypothetical protein QM042_01970 [Escherichia coli]|uniref:hypothetical protein n=1 Tax=Escherichia coli TaxID=562 RepID=UPI003987AF3A